MVGDMFNQEHIKKVKYWYVEVVQNINLEEFLLRQKSKINRLKLGDGNKSYFHSIVKGKNKQNGLYKLTDQNGKALTDFKDVEKDILKFYGVLVVTSTQSLLHVDITTLRSGAQLQGEHKEKLAKPIIEQEIWNALKNIGDDKAPCIDGFNAKVFKASWRGIKKEVIADVHDFFEENRLYPAVNSAMVTLIPKNSEAKIMIDMRPIACCTTVYKIISRILTIKLSKVISTWWMIVSQHLCLGKSFMITSL